MPLFLCNHNRIANNLMQYEQSTVPEHLSGGGGFSITKYSLDSLYEQHELVHNWWTTSNDQLPLIKYSGCKMKIYASEDVDIVWAYTNAPPMLATEQMYLSTQPSIMLLNKNKKIIPSKRTNRYSKPYKIVKIKPPTQWQNKWYFQKDIATQPLLITLCTAMSLDHYYISTMAESTNISFRTLNTLVFQLHNFQFPPSTGYHPKENYYLWATTHDEDKPKYGDLIYLGETPIYTAGQDINQTQPTGTHSKAQTYAENYKLWGNIFYHTYFNEDQTLWVSTQPPSELLKQGTNWIQDSQLNTEVNNPTPKITKLSQQLTIPCRYNPMRDKGYGNSLYLVNVLRDAQAGWQKPSNPNLITEGFPLWLLFWGWVDWQKKLSAVQQIDENYVTCFTSNAVTPQLPYYVIVDNDFYSNRSPYLKDGEITDEDRRKWYPKTKFQQVSINDICKSGPGTPKMDSKKTVEAKCEYTFYFKVGGNPAQIEKIKDPTEQGKWPIPTANNLFPPNSLQSPTSPVEYFLYNFDQRGHELTKSAFERITKDWELTKCSFTDGNLLSKSCADSPPTLQALQEEDHQTQTQEETEASLFEQLVQQRHKQRVLKQRIFQLMAQNLS